MGQESRVVFSDANYYPEDGEQPGARIGKMLGKPGVSIWNLLLVPLTLFFSLLTGACVMQSATQILREKDYYDLDTDKAGRVTADSLTYSGVVSVPFILCFGLLFDLVGRRIMSVIAFLIGAISTIMFPAVSPSILGYDVARILFV